MYGNDRDSVRRVFFRAWSKRDGKQPLEPIEQLIVSIIEQHPEYQAMLEQSEDAITTDYGVENGQTNPFLHMGMHISIAEQLQTDTPGGIRALYEELARRSGDPHATEHRMMECLGQVLWQAQRDATEPDQQAYLRCLRKLVK